MSLELVNTVSTVGTFLVIAATAVVAIVQLRHLRSSNHITAINELRETMETQEFQEARHFIETELAARLEDPTFRKHLVDRSARTDETRPLFAKVVFMGNFFEALGMLMKARLVDPDMAVEMWSGVIAEAWESLEPAIAMIRRANGNSVWENFEYATVLSQDWLNAHPHGTYPAGMRRIRVKDVWLEADSALADR